MTAEELQVLSIKKVQELHEEDGTIKATTKIEEEVKTV